MKVKVKLFGLLPHRFSHYNPAQGMEIDIPYGAKVRDLLACLKISKSEGGVVIANGIVLKSESRLEGGMCLQIFFVNNS